MLIFNVLRVLELRGVDHPYSFLTKLGMSRSVAANLTAYQVKNIKINHLEKICRALNCSPNDLFEWRDSETQPLNENHSLNSLKRNLTPKRFSQTIKEIPVDKLEKVEEFLNQLKNEE